jgi:hypothetical protein
VRRRCSRPRTATALVGAAVPGGDGVARHLAPDGPSGNGSRAGDAGSGTGEHGSRGATPATKHGATVPTAAASGGAVHVPAGCCTQQCRSIKRCHHRAVTTNAREPPVPRLSVAAAVTHARRGSRACTAGSLAGVAGSSHRATGSGEGRTRRARSKPQPATGPWSHQQEEEGEEEMAPPPPSLRLCGDPAACSGGGEGEGRRDGPMAEEDESRPSRPRERCGGRKGSCTTLVCAF